MQVERLLRSPTQKQMIKRGEEEAVLSANWNGPQNESNKELNWIANKQGDGNKEPKWIANKQGNIEGGTRQSSHNMNNFN